jgi:hypothetical protein
MRNVHLITKEQEGADVLHQYLYITSEEEIKGDWFLRKGKIHKSRYNDGNGNLWTKNGLKIYASGSKKIILTTDPDLIAEGVQPIDNEFLEWFVKNPSCEFVDAKKGFADGTAWGYNFLDYKIIIPQEEPKQIKCYCGHTITCDCSPLEETFEEVADEYFKISHSRLVNEQQKEYERELFIAGYKLAQERMYSEEEVFSLMCKAFEAGYKKYDVVEAGLEGLETEIECNWILKK